MILKIKRFLKSGFMSFAVGVSAIFVYVFYSPYQIGPHTNGSVSVINILFTALFLTVCCAVAYLYGKRKNKSGMIGLICVFALPLLTLILFYIPYIVDSNPLLELIAVSPAIIIFFSYATLFLDIRAVYYMPAVMIILIYISWFFGKKRTEGLSHVGTNETNEQNSQNKA